MTHSAAKIRRPLAKAWKAGLTGFLLLTTLGIPAWSVQHPSYFVNAEEIKILKGKIGQEPWKGAYSNMISEANRALGKGPYYLPLPYNHRWLNGSSQTTVEKNSGIGYDAHRHKAMEFGHYLINAAMAWQFTGEKKYMDWIEKNINAWFLDPKTYMEPIGATVGVNASFFPVCYGVDLAMNGLNPALQGKVKDWFGKFHESVVKKVDGGGWSSSNNRGQWWQAAVIYTGLLAGNTTHMAKSADAFRSWPTSPWEGEIIFNTGDKGKPVLNDPKRGGRPDFKYQDFQTACMHVVLELNRHTGTDLYNYQVVGGRSKYERLMDGQALLAKNEKTYAFENFEMANWYKPKAEWDRIVRQIGRPINFATWDHGVGPLTLTHHAGGIPFKVYSSGQSSTLIGQSPTRQASGNNRLIELSALELIRGRVVPMGDRSGSPIGSILPALRLNLIEKGSL